ncbi:MAG: hypothetical protein GQ574_14435 [Crocinitomix sp.]|nr:hypothetical protein [Crocinitomix sp.]
MKTRILLGLLSFVSISAMAQNVIRIRPQHQKEHIYTLKEGERFYHSESKLFFQTDGVNYSFRTALKGSFYLHERGKAKKRLSFGVQRWYYPNRYKNCRVTRKDNKFTVKHLKSGRSYGPFKYSRFLFDKNLKQNRTSTNYTTASDLHAFCYSKILVSDSAFTGQPEGREYYIVVPGEKSIGPYESAEICMGTAQDLVYKYSIGDSVYLNENGKIHGPYDEVVYAKGNPDQVSPRGSSSLFFYKTNNIWYASHPDLQEYSLNARPQYSVNFYTAYIREKENEKCQIFPNGEILPYTREHFFSQNRLLDDLEFNWINESVYPQQYEVRYQDSLLGVFSKGISTSLGGSPENQSDFFYQGLVKCDSLGQSDSIAERLYFFSPTKGWVGPFKDERINRIYFIGETSALHSYSDSTLKFQDGRFYEQVVATHFTDPASDWWMLKREGYYDQPYKNGKKYSGNKLPEKFDGYRTPNKSYVLVKQNGEEFIKTKNSNRLIGPVSSGSEIAVSNDAKNYAEGLRNGNFIWINNKLISEGFNLVYNEQLEAFHWFNIDEKKRIYLHTYELN